MFIITENPILSTLSKLAVKTAGLFFITKTKPSAKRAFGFAKGLIFIFFNNVDEFCHAFLLFQA